MGLGDTLRKWLIDDTLSAYGYDGKPPEPTLTEKVEAWFHTQSARFIASMTGVFAPASPPPELEESLEKMAKALLEAVEDVSTTEHGSLPAYESMIAAATAVIVKVLGVKVVTEGLGAAIDSMHPVKGLKAWEIAAGITGSLGVPNLIGPLLSVPVETGIMRPYGYYWNQKNPTMLPGMTDLVRMELREVFRPEFRSELITDEPISGEFAELAAYQGFDQKMAENYWGAHWELPGISQAYDMYHRLRKGRVPDALVFDRSDLDSLLKRLDVLKRYRAQLVEIAHPPFTRVDVRRMYRLGVLDYAGVVEAYKDLGYDEEHAVGLADFTKMSYDEYERDTSKSDILRFFREGLISEDAAHARLKVLGYRDDDIAFYIDLEKIALAAKAEVKERALTKADIVGLLTDGLIDAVEAKQKLLGLNYLESDVDLLLGRVMPDVPGRVKKATVSDFKTAFREGIITEDDLREELLARDYTPSETEMIISTEIARMPVPATKLTATKFLEAFRKGVISEMELRSKLAELGYSMEEIEIAIAMNVTATEAVTKTLTKAEVVKAWTKEIIDIEECVDRLTAMGYDQYDIGILLEMASPAEEEAVE